MDAGRLQTLAVPTSCTLPSCPPTHPEQLQLLVPCGWLKAATPGLAFQLNVQGPGKPRGPRSTVVRAAIAHDLAAVAVAAATVLPVCWMYVNRSQFSTPSPSGPPTSSSTKQDTSSSSASSSAGSAPTVAASTTALAELVPSSATRRINGALGVEVHDLSTVNGVSSNRQSQGIAPAKRVNAVLVEDPWLGDSSYESLVASVTAIDEDEISSGEFRNSLGGAPASIVSRHEQSAYDAAVSSLPRLPGDSAYPESSGLFTDMVLQNWSLDVDDDSAINEGRSKSGSLASTPEPTVDEILEGNAEVVDTSITDVDIAQLETLLPEAPKKDASGFFHVILELDNSVQKLDKDSSSAIAKVKVNGTYSSLRSGLDDTTVTEGASSSSVKVSPNGASNGSSRARSETSSPENGVSVVRDRMETDVAEVCTERKASEADLDDSNRGKLGHGLENSENVRGSSELAPTISDDTNAGVVGILNAVSDTGVEVFVGKVNGHRQTTSLVDVTETSLAKQISSTKLKGVKLTDRSSFRLPQSLSEILPLNKSADPEFCLKVYKKLLRAGRLQDCIVLLEEMENMKKLNTDKIHHAQFFQTCRKQKAVREAFRFMRLIKGPKLSGYNMLLNVCREAGDVDGGLRVLSATEKAGLKPDIILYTTLLSTCAKAGKVDIAFKVFHEMEGSGIAATIETYGAMIDGCARTGQIAKAFGVYGIMISKKLKPDHVIFNTLINACGRAGAIERAFDVLADMRAEPFFLKPNHVTIGALISACGHAGQVDRAFEVYRNMRKWGIKGTPECYTAVVHSCSSTGNLDLALSVLEDMKRDEVKPDEIFFSALIDVAGHSKQADRAFDIVEEMKKVAMVPGVTTYSAVMGVCCNTGNWERALEVYNEVRAANLVPTVSTFNALITALCDARQLEESCSVLQEMKEAGVQADQITYSILLDACEKLDEPERAFDLYTTGRAEGVVPNQAMCESVTALCYAKITQKLPSASSPYSIGLLAGQNNEAPYEQWASWAIAVYRHTVAANVVPTIKSLSLLLGCLRIPEVPREKNKVLDDMYSHIGNSRIRPSSILEGAGFYDPRAVALFDEAVAMGVVPQLNYTAGPITVNAETMPSYVAEVYLVTLLKGLKQRHLAGAQLFPVTIYYLTEKKQTLTATKEVKEVTISGRTGQAVAALLRRLRLQFQGHESSGKLRIPTASIRKWLKPPTTSLPTFQGLQRHQEVGPLGPPHTFLAQGIAEQQRAIRMGQVFKNSADIERVSSGGKQALVEMYRSQQRTPVNSWDHNGNSNDFDFNERVKGFRQRMSRKGELGKGRP